MSGQSLAPQTASILGHMSPRRVLIVPALVSAQKILPAFFLFRDLIDR
jgi:hypothetical protein